MVLRFFVRARSQLEKVFPHLAQRGEPIGVGAGHRREIVLQEVVVKLLLFGGKGSRVFETL